MRALVSPVCTLIAFVTLGGLAARSAIAEGPDPRTVRTWKAKCAACHGEDGKGQTEQGKKMGIGDMSSSAWQKQFTDAQITDVVNKGIKREKNGKHQEMDPFSAALRPEQITALVGYVRSLAK
jgi:mono/diheme cytochrome c family protein